MLDACFRSRVFAAALSLSTLAGLAPALAQPPAAGHPETLAGDLWSTAREGDMDALKALLQRIADRPTSPLADDASELLGHFADREAARQTRLKEVRDELTKALAEPRTDTSLAKALRSAIELHTLTPEGDKAAVLASPEVKSLVADASKAAEQAEANGSIIAAGELYVLLDVLNDVAGTYRDDVKRISAAQEMLRMYAPHKLWELRNQRAQAEGNKPLPPYNAFGDDWKDKLDDIDQPLVERALAYTRRHIEQQPLSTLVLGGLENLQVLAKMQNLRDAFPGLGDETARQEFLEFLDKQEAAIRSSPQAMDPMRLGGLLNSIRQEDEQTVKVPRAVLLHEFGQGAFGRLDDFSQIIWPDQVRRFNKDTQGHFVGVGIQIEYDELQNIRVVSPIEGTPAQRAGIHPGDIITKVNGQALYGLSLDQAVEVITGPENSTVTLTVDRSEPDAGAPDGKKTTSLDFPLKRTIINVASVRGWERTGVKEDSWNWFIDGADKIAYVRLSQFSDTSAQELERAAAQITREGAKGLIFDLRFNPGGLLDQAVLIAQKFIDVPNDFVVMTQGPSGRIDQPEYTAPARATLADIPVVVLVNEGSASASEIVSGAISTYAHRGQADALVLGARSYGKGSVQNVFPITSSAMMKLTTAYYMLPNRTIIHRRPGMTAWGIEPDLKVEMLPKQTSDAILLRRNADVVALDENGAAKTAEPRPDPEDLINKGLDLQLETALILLKGRVAEGSAVAHRTE